MIIAPPPFDTMAAFGIAMLAVLVASAWVAIFARGNRVRALRLFSVAATLLGASAAAAASGVLTTFDVVPPPMAVMIALVLAVPLVAGLSSFGRSAAAEVPLVALVGFQSFRLPLELVMHHAATVGIMPVQMSYSGYNYDIVTGAGAVVLAVLMAVGVRVPRGALWTWNAWGLYCLAAIAAIAITTSPIVRAFGDDPQNVNTWVLYFPYVWLPVVMVTAALFGHIVITRKLLSEPAI